MIRKEYSKETIKALDGSINKWFDVTFRGSIDNGWKDCPLCYIFNTSGKVSCMGCPIAEDVRFTGQENPLHVGCSSTPYKNWTQVTPINDRKVHDDSSATAAYNFYKWLVDLRARVYEKKEEMTYKLGDLFRGSYKNGLYVLASVGYTSKFNLIRLNHPYIGTRIGESVEVANSSAITQAEIDKISQSISVEKVEGMLTFTEGGNKSCD